ncbi:MAG: response regulator [Desulfobacterales bacterium]|nr:response regulator [Desulfobacterales bacterium]
MNNRIIVIDDEDSILKAYLSILSPDEKAGKTVALEAALFGTASVYESEEERYELTTVLQGEEGYEKVKQARENGYPFALAFIDIRMPPGWDGLKTATMIRKADPDIELVIITAYSDRERSEIIQKVGNPERLLYLKKPFDPEEIRQIALSLTRKWDLERKAETYRKCLERLLLSVKRLKTHNISTVKEILPAILNEVLLFVGAEKGVIVNADKGKIIVKAVSANLPDHEKDFFTENVSERLSDTDENISLADNIMVLTLKNSLGKLFILVSSPGLSVHDEKYNLLNLLLETSSEVLESLRKQEQYLKNEKIATIGQIAAGIIHEINNPLTAIIGAADLYSLDGKKMWELFKKHDKMLESLMHYPEIEKLFKGIKKEFNTEVIRMKMNEHHIVIQRGAEQIRCLMDNIRKFSKTGDGLEMKLRDISEALENTLILARNSLKYGVTVRRNWKTPLMARCDISGLRQVFLNLVLNAAQAMKETGELEITGIKKDGKIFVSVKDSGPGISEEVRERLFEAFYTTKADGTGLGLSIVKGIIDDHKGIIRVESELGRGTTFHIELPVE